VSLSGEKELLEELGTSFYFWMVMVTKRYYWYKLGRQQSFANDLPAAASE